MDLIDANTGAIDFGHDLPHVFKSDGLMTDIETEPDVLLDGAESVSFGGARPEPVFEEFDRAGRFVEPAARFRLDAKANDAARLLFDAVQDGRGCEQVFHTVAEEFGKGIDVRKAQGHGRNASLDIGRQELR